MKVIQVKFRETVKHYSYYTDDESIEVGDHAVVVVAGVPVAVKVVKTVGLSRTAIERATKLVAFKIDLSEYRKRVETLDTIIEIKNELRKAKEQQDEMAMYIQLAKTNPKINSLVEKLKSLDPSSVPQLSS